MYRKKTTSFLEQDNSGNSVSKRQKKKSVQSAKAEQSSKPATAPPRPVSSTTKAQLGAYAFRKPSSTSPPGHNDKHELDHKKKQDTDALDLTPELSPSEKESYQSPLSTDCPKTPAPRLALKDLVEFKEDGQPPAFNIAPDVSPERIVWQVSPRGTPAATQMTPAAKRQKRKKRAKSSSPPIAPHRATPVPKKKLDQSPTTPHTHTTSNLAPQQSDRNSGFRPPNPLGVPSRLFSAEKRNSLNLSPLGLRRSYSCGSDWPPMGLKRRKIDSMESHSPEIEEEEDKGEEEEEFLRANEDLETVRQSIVPPRRRGANSKLSRVNMLLEKLSKSSTQPNDQSSSPPVSLMSGSYDMPSSPTRNAIKRRAKQAIEVPKSTLHTKHDMSDNENYDDGFDDEMDMEMFEKVEEVAVAFTQQQKHKQQQGGNGSKNVEPNTTARNHETMVASASDFDEFDFENDDHDLDDIDVDTLVSQASNEKSIFQHRTSSNDTAGVTQGTEDVVDEFGDIDFGEWDDEELDSVADINSGTVRRFTVSEISEGEWEDKGRYRLQKIIKLCDVKSGMERTVFIRDDWYHVNVENGDIVHVIAKTNIINNTNGMLIVNPDFLVSSTTIADSFGCKRRAALQDRVKATGDISKPLIYGSILHELFQKALISNDFSDEFLLGSIDELLSQHIQQLYILKEEVSVTKDYLTSKFELLKQWAKLFISVQPKRAALASDHRGSDRPNLCINKVLDIEEHVWSPMYGIKGNIDATVQTTIKDKKSERTLTVPLELKTGRNSTSTMHRAQTMIYTLLLKDRYDIDVLCGLLYYMESSEIIRIPSISAELRGMIIARNELAWYAKRRDVLPDMLKQHGCNSCFAKKTCFIYHKALEDGTAETSGALKQFEEITGHIKDSHKQFLKRWDQLLSKEESDMTRFRKELWSMTSTEREKYGRCFGNLVVIPESIMVAKEASKVNRYTYQLRKADGLQSLSFLDSQIGVGDPIVISDEKGHFALAMGFVINIVPTKITVAVDRRLHNARIREEGFDAQYNQTFAGIMEVGRLTRPTATREHPILLRLDKDELTSGMALIRNNLIDLLSNKTSDRTRELIIDQSPPIFRVDSTAYPLDEIRSQLNCDQLEAIKKIMSTSDYALILGMPGTGKTTTIGHIIRTLVSQGKSVLLTSYTHTAVDNILLKIKDDGISILRLGNTTKVHPKVREFAILAESPRSSFKEIHEAFMLPKVVATTCLGINHHIFDERVFDYCIVDEASQITLPVCLGPIRMAKKFILVGDHYQLPPLVKNQAAKEGGLDISLFKLLSDAHPNAVVSLEHQYRMCEEIMSLSNKLIYDGRLKCGNEAVARRTLKLPCPEGLSKLHSSMVQGTGNACNANSCWIGHLLDERVKVTFLNTDDVPASEVKKKDRIDNPVEAQLTFQLVESLIESGVDPATIGVISVYRSQVKAIQYLLRGRPDVEMHTADKFQGRDKECIIISLVRSNADGNIGDLLKDWRRINVAFTRARSKLIILGSKSTLTRNELLKKFVDLMEENQWIYDLPVNAHLSHTIQTPSSPVKRERTSNVNAQENTFRGQKKPKTGTMQGRVLFAKRPVLKDIANDLGLLG